MGLAGYGCALAGAIEAATNRIAAATTTAPMKPRFSTGCRLSGMVVYRPFQQMFSLVTRIIDARETHRSISPDERFSREDAMRTLSA